MELLKEFKNIVDEVALLEAELLEQLVLEGVDDPGILKCIFMAGGPGSGKSFVAQEIFGIDKNLRTSVAASGLKVVNSDPAFEAQLKKHGINPKDLAKIEKEEPELWDFITKNPQGPRETAKKQVAKFKEFYEAGRLGMIIDGTGDNYDKVARQKKEAEALGYDTYMVFVNTSLEVAKERNLQRSRVVPEELLTKSWKACQDNMGKFQTMFSGNFRIVDNSKTGNNITSDIQKGVDGFIREPLRNPIGKKWVTQARILKQANIIKR